MRKVIGIGETMLDIIFKNSKPIEAVPGGSTFNAIVSLGRAGVPCTFFSEAGNDRVGEYIKEFLRDNGVDADNARQSHGASPFLASPAKKSLAIRCSSWFSRKYSMWLFMSSTDCHAAVMAAVEASGRHIMSLTLSYIPTLS